MTSTMTTPDATARTGPDVDVLVVGAGISGIGAAWHLRDKCPDHSFVVLEGAETFGGTWRIHTYPGTRSDSDLHTFGYEFKPWTGSPIAPRQLILDYLDEVIEENDLDDHIRYQHRIETASWSSETATWTVNGTRDDTGERFTCTANFLYMCQGYYRHSEGYRPTWPGMDRFGGPIVHPQTWPDDIDYAGKRIVVIGSGATAATLIPALAPEAEHVTMLQRSPTFFRANRNVSELAEQLRSLEVPEEWIHEIERRWRLKEGQAFTDLCFSDPAAAREMLYDNIRDHLKPELHHLIEEHFSPSYLPWRERIAVVPDGDLFQAINDGKASVVTDQIATFTETGIELESGEVLEADIIVTATGFNLNVLGDVAFTIDGDPLDFHETVTYHGAMFTGIPNMVWVFGYFRASWTLRADLIAHFVCRLLRHMRERGATVVVPELLPEERDMELGPWIDPENFNPGYVRRGLHLLPKQGDRKPWQHGHEYWSDRHTFDTWDLDDARLRYS